MTNGRGLTATQRASLKRDGYLLVPSLLEQRVLARIRHRLDELVRQTIAAWQAGRVQDIAEPGVVRVQLDLTDAGFAACHQHPLLADAATTLLGPGWHLAALNLRAPLPGCGHQGLHPDFEQRRTGEPWQTLSAMWIITAFSADNGPLRVIPGSHRVSEPPIDMQAFGSGMGPHPERGQTHRARRIGDLVQQRRPVALRHLQLQHRAAPGDNGRVCSRPPLVQHTAQYELTGPGSPAAVTNREFASPGPSELLNSRKTGFDAFYCEPGIGGAHEKGGVEGEIGRFRRNFLVPVPRVASLADLNARLAEDDLKDARRHIEFRRNTVAADFAAEAPLLRPLPADGFDTGTALWPKADRFARISVGKCRYSVPARLIGTAVRVRLTANELHVFDGRQRWRCTRGWWRAGTSTWCWTTTWRSLPASRARCPARCRSRRHGPTGRSRRRTRPCGRRRAGSWATGPGRGR